MTTPLMNIEHFDLPKLKRLEIEELDGFDFPEVQDMDSLHEEIKDYLKNVEGPDFYSKVLADLRNNYNNKQSLRIDDLFEDLDLELTEFLMNRDDHQVNTKLTFKDRAALSVDRGDCKLTISTIEMIKKNWQFDMDNSSYCFFSGINTHVAAINREWIGGGALATWFIDFRTKIPRFIGGGEFWLRGIAELGSGELVIWDDNVGYYTLDNQTFEPTEVGLDKVCDECDVLFKDLKDPWLLS